MKQITFHPARGAILAALGCAVLAAAQDTVQVSTNINDLADKVVAEYREVEATYDRKTTHGASQAAHFP